MNSDRMCRIPGKTHEPASYILLCMAKGPAKVSKGAKIRNRYNQVPHLTQDINGKVTNLQLDTSNESQEVSPFPAGDHNAHMNRRAQRDRKNIKDSQKKYHTSL